MCASIGHFPDWYLSEKSKSLRSPDFDGSSDSPFISLPRIQDLTLSACLRVALFVSVTMASKAVVSRRTLRKAMSDPYSVSAVRPGCGNSTNSSEALGSHEEVHAEVRCG